ncbi:MAG: FimV/HubP family polar landmark protein [Gammaproteobacteria bacterium]
MPRVPLAAGWLLAGLIPLSVGALGLGEISLKSALNQELVAEIPVTTDSSDDLSRLDVRLASAETFQRFGLDRPQFLNTLNFTVDRAGGMSRILVTSSLPVSEPFVSLLLDITWPQGHLLREYTMLLDPPAFARAGAGQPAAALPATSSPTPAVKRIERPMAQPEAAAAAAAGQAGQGGDERLVAGTDGSSYGPVRANETLWAISERLNTDSGVSLNAMMVALYRANPEAFAGNINLLKRGAILRVPAGAELAALSAGEAMSEVRRQNEAWRAGAEGAPAAARLQLVPPEEKPVATTPSTLAQQAPAKADASQVKALEQQLAESRRLLDLKDSQLKALQDRLQVGGQSSTVERPVEAPIEAPVARLPIEDQATPEADEASGDEVAADEDSAALADKAAPVKRAAAKRKPKRSEGSWLDSLGGLIFNSYFLIAAAAVVLAGLFVVFGRRRMAQADDDSTGRFSTLPKGSSVGGAAEGEPTLRDSFIVEESEAQRTGEMSAQKTAVASAPGRGGRKVGGDSETAFERTISTDGAVEIDQADVVAEAEFHMAYGLYDQAAELLVRALRDNPDRRDLRLKLLEVYFIWENKPAFLKEAQIFHRQTGGDQSPDWNKVLIMGKQICPGEALFAAGAGAAGLDISLDGDSVDSVDFSLDDNASDSVDLDLTGARRGPAADLLDFDFGEIAGTDDIGIDATGLMKTEIAPGLQGVESPTVEAPFGDLSPTMETPTMETPTVEFRSPDAPTVETPTLETPAAGGTMETPTIESAAITGSRTGLLADLEGHDYTEEINVEDLAIDLTGLDEAAGDLGTGLYAGVDEGQLDASSEDEVFDIGDADGEIDEDLSDILQSLEGDATSEMRSMSLDEGTLDLPAIGTAMEKSAASRDATNQLPSIDDTAEQPRGGLPDRAFGEESGELSQVDFDIGDRIEDSEPTSVITPRKGRGPEGPTMTEVGTKLDLARAYVDMGDPDGARSILNEVLEEGDSAQQQEARKLLDELAD